MNKLLEIFQLEKTCEYRGETYLVRDNGAVFRYRKPGKRKRPLDEQWTFGNPNKQTGYMNIASETVHRIVATAFHGQQPSDIHIVDHIDTNKRNNRPENLRWLTRLENLLLNPITLSRINYKYGSIDNFLSDPSKPLNGRLDQNFKWMRTVSKEESENARNNLLNMAREGKISRDGNLGEWIFSQLHSNKYEASFRNELVQSLTKNVLQKNWETPSEFPNCPNTTKGNALSVYKTRLVKGYIFSKSHYGESIVEDSEISQGNRELIVITRIDNVKPFALAKVYIEENHFIHENIGSFFKLDGAQKGFTEALGFKWQGGEVFDDLVS